MDKNNDFDGGEPVDLGFGNKLVFYPISWGDQRKNLSAQWTTVFGRGAPGGSDEWIDAVVEIFYYSVNRTRMHLPEDERTSRVALGGMIDHRNASECFKALSIASGFRKRDAVKAEGSAESDPTSPQNGGSSIPASSPRPDGTSNSVTTSPGLVSTL